MSIIAGITGQPAELIDGAKVNSLIPLTAGNGVQLEGRTNGVAIEAGKVGEKITWVTPPAANTNFTAEADWTNAYITLTPGVWLVIANVNAAYGSATTSDSYGAVGVKLTTSANAIVENQDKTLLVGFGDGTRGATIKGTIPLSCVVYPSSNTVYKLRGLKIDSSGTGVALLYNENNARSEFFAVRIA